MTKAEKQQLEATATQLREAADKAHDAAAQAEGQDATLNKAADEAEDAALKAEKEAQSAVVDDEEEDDLDEGDDEGEDDENIDFEDEAKKLGIRGNPPAPNPLEPSKSELEKAESSLRHNAKKVRELGGDPTKVIDTQPPAPPANPPARRQGEEGFVTQDDLNLRDLRGELRRLAKSAAEYEVLVYHAENSIKRSGDPVKDAENAYMIAHKGRITRSFDEIRRASFSRPARGTTPGRRPVQPRQVQMPELTADEKNALRRRGYQQKADGSWESKRRTLKFDPKRGWVEEMKKK